MGKKLRKKAPKKNKTSQKNFDNGSINWGLCGRRTFDSESLQNEDEQDLSGLNLLSSGDIVIYPFEDDESDSETTKCALMGEKERYQVEVEFKRLTEKLEINKIY